MKRNIFFLSLMLFLFLAIKPIEAHVLKYDGSIGGILHIDPDDDPISGTPSNFYIEFKDKQNKFSLNSCICTAVIYEQNNNKVYSQELTNALSDNNNWSSVFSMTFPAKGVYLLVITGKPLDTVSFQPFILKYNIRVAREWNTENQNILNNKYLYYGIFLLVIVALIAAFAYNFFKKRNKL